MVCVVDDDTDLLGALRFALEIDGYTVRAYNSGETLLAETSPAPEAACLVLDYLLPGMNGIDLLEALRRRGVTSPAILITTHPSALLRRRAAGLGVRIVEKPLFGENLARAIGEEIASRA
ncbi:MAG TPA: response regulator [Hyphomicrobiales bacterium]|nr:response regulator [Hyphomicrobiales bacterium]